MQKENRSELHKKIVLNLLLTVVIILGIWFLLPPLLRFFMPVIIAWIMAMISGPMIRFMEKRVKIMPKHGSIIVIITALGLIGVTLYLIIAALFSQISSILEDLPEIYRTVLANLQEAMNSLHSRYHIIPDNINILFDSNESKIDALITSAVDSVQSGLVTSVGSAASSIIDVFVLTILTVMFAYFFIAKRTELTLMLKKYTPEGMRQFYKMARETTLVAIGGYFKACFKIMFLMFIILWIIMLVLQVKYAALIAAITAILDFLPFVGTGTILIPWALYALITGDYFTAVVLVGTYLVTMITRRIVEPKLVGDSVGISTFAALFFMFIGYRLIGMLGLIIGIPVGMIVMSFYENGLFETQIKGIKILANDINEYRKY